MIPSYSNEILLMEDNDSDAELTIRALEKNNLANKIIRVKDGVEGLDYLFCRGAYAGKNKNDLPRLILLDLRMPKMSGLDILQVIKEHDVLRAIPVAVLTSSDWDPDIKRCYDLGVNSYIIKPVNFDDFVKAVMHLGMYWMLTNHQS
jgi:two-component system response regulator